ncbi:MAG TPA: class I SAM-dependent methyltransferase [Spirochaetota bacterium]|nr:class I SAM-dependent methyltransferase [Spirochaetota bacterium]HPR49931.1 class I SAM-dependent methyltransferase [Spirochaetota bacterium]
MINIQFDKLATLDEFIHLFDSIKPEFYDFGCSKGGSMLLAQRVFAQGNKTGIGIDISHEKVNLAKAAGLMAIAFDILDIPPDRKVKFTIMSEFLEHVNDFNDVKRFIRKACDVSTDFIFIKQPYFDADGYLFRLGLKCFWSHWTGHPNTMSTLDLYRILKELKNNGIIGKFSIHVKHPVLNSSDPVIIPLESKIDQHHYDSVIHPPKKKKIKFKFPVYQQTVVFITMPGVEHGLLLKKYEVDETIIDENEKIIF